MQLSEVNSVHGLYRTLSLSRDVTPDELRAARRYVRGRIGRPDLPIQHTYEQPNLTPTIGRTVLTRLLTGDTTYSGEINYGALGSGTTPFTVASTELNTEVYRKLNADAAFDDNIAYVDWFIASGDVADDTYEEFGAFIDGTGSADSGQLFSAVITDGWVKSGALFISLSVTIT